MNNFQMISYLTGRSECYNRFGGVVAGCLAWLETGVAREAALGLGVLGGLRIKRSRNNRHYYLY